MIICKICNPRLAGNGYCAEHSTSGSSYNINNMPPKINKENCGGKSCGWTGDECTCNLGWDDTKTNNEWEKEFLRMNGEKFHYLENEFEQVKSFIHSLLSSERQRLRKNFKKRFVFSCSFTGGKCSFSKENCKHIWGLGYNKALEDGLKLLEE